MQVRVSLHRHRPSVPVPRNAVGQRDVSQVELRAAPHEKVSVGAAGVEHGVVGVTVLDTDDGDAPGTVGGGTDRHLRCHLKAAQEVNSVTGEDLSGSERRGEGGQRWRVTTHTERKREQHTSTALRRLMWLVTLQSLARK